MSEPTLTLTYDALAAAVGTFLGYGRGSFYSDTAWTATQTAIIDDCVRSGCRKFYHPMPTYDWSFLHVFVDPPLEFAPKATSVRMPDDAAGIEGDIVVGVKSQSVWFPPLMVGNPQRVKSLYAMSPTATGYPIAAAIEQLKGTTVAAGQRQRLIIYPAADQDYTLAFQYYVEPDAPVSAATPTLGSPYVYGGPAHAETILESCLAVAEVRRDDMAGLHTQQFAERLMASMAADRRSKPQYLGQNRDGSDDAEGSRRWWPNFPPTVLYNGQSTN